MRYYPPADPCDEPMCITLATLEIVREKPGTLSTPIVLACEWHVQRLWDGLMLSPELMKDSHITGYYIQRHIA